MGAKQLKLSKKYLICKTHVSRSSHKAPKARNVIARATPWVKVHELLEALKARDENGSDAPPALFRAFSLKKLLTVPTWAWPRLLHFAPLALRSVNEREVF